MNWSDIKSAIGDAAPIVGTLLGGPLGGDVGGLVARALGVSATPDAVSAALKADPAAMAKIATVEAQFKEAQLQADTTRIQAVNATMQAEAKSEHWPEWSWRPFNGFLFGPTILAVYFVLPLLKIPVPAISSNVWVMWGSVLGVTAWHRGIMQRVKAGDAPGGLLGKLFSK